MHALFPCGERERKPLSAATCPRIVGGDALQEGCPRLFCKQLQTGGARLGDAPPPQVRLSRLTFPPVRHSRISTSDAR